MLEAIMDAKIDNNLSSKYSSASIEKITSLSQAIKENPEMRIQYARMFTSLEDFKLFYELNPQWEGKSTEWMQKKTKLGSSFYQGLMRWAKKESDGDKTKKQELMQEIFKPKLIDRKNYTSLDNWIEEYEKNPEWHGKTASQMIDDKTNKGSAFYYAFQPWCRDEAGDDQKKYKELLRSIIPTDYVERSHYASIDDWTDEFNQNFKWQGKNTRTIIDEDGGKAFYAAFSIWVNKQAEGDTEKQKELMGNIFPELRVDWSSYTTIDDWKNEFSKHEEWKGASLEEMKSNENNGCAFYGAFRKWVNKESGTDKKKKKELLTRLFDFRILQRDHYESIDDWIKEHNEHPEWQGKSTTEIIKPENKGSGFYQSFKNWCEREAEIDPDVNYKSLFRTIFPERKAPFKYSFDGREEYFDSYPERIVGILLYDLGMTDLVEGETLHVRTNGSKLHSVDYLVDKTFIEYHPLGIQDRKNGLTLEESGERKKINITNSEFDGYDFKHIWEINQLYPLLQEEELQTNIKPEFNNLSKEEFETLVSKTYAKAIAYDAKLKKN